MDAFQRARNQKRYRVYFRRSTQNVYRWDAFDDFDQANTWADNLVHEAKNGRKTVSLAQWIRKEATIDEVKWFCVTLIDMTPGRDVARDTLMQLGGAPPERLNDPAVIRHWSVDGSPPPDLLLEMIVEALAQP